MSADHDSIALENHVASDDASWLETMRDRLCREIDVVSSEYADPICDAAIKQRAQSLILKFDTFVAFLREFQEGKLRLTKPDHVRQTTYSMLCRLAARCRTSNIADGSLPHRTTYRSVSIPTTKDYFRRPLMRTLGRQFDQAVVDMLGHPIENTTPVLTLDRIIIVPDRYWPFMRRLEDKQKRWWKPLFNALGESFETYRENGSVGSHVRMRLRFLNRATLKELQLDPATVDFGLYGDIMVGIYTSTGGAEQLTLYRSGSMEMQTCEAAWRELTHADRLLRPWEELADAVDIDEEVA